MTAQKNRQFLTEQKDLCDRAIHLLRRNSTLKNSAIAACLEDIALEGLLYMMAVARKNHVKKAISLYITL